MTVQTNEKTIGAKIRALCPCPLCASQDALILHGKDGKTSQPLLTIQCEDCGLGRIDPLPSKDELERWYTNEYRQDYKGSFQPQLRHVLRAGRLALDRWQWLRSNLPAGVASESIRALDIGASSGEWVYLLSSKGVNAEGIEPHEGYGSFARSELGLNIQAGNIDRHLPFKKSGERNLISMFHVFEHLVDPVQTLELIARTLGESGHLYIEVPNTLMSCVPSSKFFRAHTLYFTPHTLEKMIVSAGYSVLQVTTDELDNIRILAKPGAKTELQRHAPHNRVLADLQASWHWLPYALGKARTGAPLGRLAKQIEERKTASNYQSAKQLLTAIYR
jgi:SAM-dependent methyltransferase